MTPAGQQAYGILEWVYADAPARVAEGQERMRQLALGSPDDNDVTDAGTMLSRLAGTFSSQARTITDQVR
jgi:hypothetical protein